ncbi:MAG: murein biosynthesis integral membrane protein MurJ [Candidatus Portnoybacteria bacterium]|nr:murein biosynthesis integral membrane protein MurJ [Candidatus Portnoybacteria bacterium]MDD4982544.1 murein biosynthesis integral membrane protein MurJ [Candidatus Portnoybacteria bacterium]
MFKFLTDKIFNGQSRSITSAALVLALASLASRFLGLLRDRLLAGQFGAGDTLDVYYAAFRIPDTVYNLLVLGALSAGFIPVFIGLWNRPSTSLGNNNYSPSDLSRAEAREVEGSKNRREVWDFVNNVLNILGLGLMVVAAVFFIFAPFFVKLITPGFGTDKMNLTVALTRVMFLSPILLGASSIWGGILQGVKKFLIFSLTPIFYNLGIIFGILFLVPRFGIYGLAWGVVLGAFLHMAIQIPSILSLGYKYRPIFNWADSAARRMAKLTVPRILTLAVAQINFLAITILASTLAAGSLAIFDLSYNIYSFPLGILAGSLAMAAFPALAGDAKAGDKNAFAKTLSSTFRQILFLIIPASALFIVLRAQIVRVILGTGRFSWANTISAINTLEFLVVGLFAEALNLLLVRGFFALEDTKTPFWLGFLSSFVRIGLAWYFSFSLGVAGLALGYALGGILNMVLLWLSLERKTGRAFPADSGKSGVSSLLFGEIFASGVKILSASILTGVVAWRVLLFMDKFVDTRTLLGLLAQGFIAGIAGLIIYFLAGLLLRSPEMQIFWQAMKNRLPFKQVASDKEIIQD